ncbi:hypothetical protein HPP92_006055 [Vanilla planifolia]|uniref:Uncharacterized protein n=1 Tax=Vanilla planifolia TaxID=51239 RepID=A0A835RV76_VANPL|nr:hypothetical protein HPP92_006055 [Vanilla planifolia]
MASTHALVLPYPAQSHVMSLLEFSYCLLDRGFRVTFVVTEVQHGRLLATLVKEHGGRLPAGLRLASIPDGLGPGENRNDLGRLTEGIMSVMVASLEELIVGSSASDEERFTCLVADQSMAWALNVAKKTDLRCTAFFPASALVLAANFSVPKLIADGVIDEEGVPKKPEKFRLSPEAPPMDPSLLCWNCFEDSKTRQRIFDYIVNNNEALLDAELVACNTFHDLEEPIFRYAPNIVPIGPLKFGSRPDNTVGNFWLHDTTCIEWLDRQQSGSVIYVAFGSFTIMSQIQFEELAIGLELTGRPFLWVVRPDLTDDTTDEMYPPGFAKRVSGRGKMVGWSPQQKVLAHPSIACFISHCGWNSTLDGVKNAVPFLCWPYFADQFFNQTYVCDVWRVGLSMLVDKDGVYGREEIRSKVEELLGDEEIKLNSMALKEKACQSVEKGGSSFENLDRFVDAIKEM